MVTLHVGGAYPRIAINKITLAMPNIEVPQSLPENTACSNQFEDEVVAMLTPRLPMAYFDAITPYILQFL